MNIQDDKTRAGVWPERRDFRSGEYGCRIGQCGPESYPIIRWGEVGEYLLEGVEVDAASLGRWSVRKSRSDLIIRSYTNAEKLYIKHMYVETHLVWR